MAGRWWRWLRQSLYAVLLVGAVMGLSALDWLGMPALRTYVLFVLTEEVDVGKALPQARSWVRERDWERLVPSWWRRVDEAPSTGDAPSSGEDV